MFGETTTSSSRTFDTENFSMGESFNGKEEDWESWKFTAVALFSIDGLGPSLHELSNYHKKAPILTDMTTERKELANMFYNQLIQRLEGTAQELAMQCEVGNGFEVWWRLQQRYEGRVTSPYKGKGRCQTMLCSLLAPADWTSCNEMDFKGKLLDWEVAIQKYEMLSQKMFWRRVQVQHDLATCSKVHCRISRRMLSRNLRGLHHHESSY